MRLKSLCGRCNHLRVAREADHQGQRFGFVQLVEVLQSVVNIMTCPGFCGFAQHARTASMSVLNVVDRILVAARQGQIDIKSELRGGCAGNQKIASRVAAYPIDQIAERYVAPGPFRQFDLCPLSHDGHHLMQHVLGPALGDADIEALQTGTHPRDGAVVVSPLLIDDPCEAPLPFIVVVGDIGHKVGIAPFAFAHHPVFVITEIGGAQPERVLLFKSVASLFQRADGLLDCATLIKR